MSASKGDVTLRRTVVYIDAVIGEHVICTPSGVDLPALCAHVWREDFPEAIRSTITAGAVFFAYANLGAESGAQVGIERIEPQWGNTGPLHFSDGTTW